MLYSIDLISSTEICSFQQPNISVSIDGILVEKNLKLNNLLVLALLEPEKKLRKSNDMHLINIQRNAACTPNFENSNFFSK